NSCSKNSKKTKITYRNDQNEETERAENSLTLTSNNAKACDQEMISEVMNNDQNTTTNTNIKIQEVSLQIPDCNNSHTVDPLTKMVWLKNKSESNDRIETESTEQRQNPESIRITRTVNRVNKAQVEDMSDRYTHTKKYQQMYSQAIEKYKEMQKVLMITNKANKDQVHAMLKAKLITDHFKQIDIAKKDPNEIIQDLFYGIGVRIKREKITATLREPDMIAEDIYQMLPFILPIKQRSETGMIVRILQK
ncbi:1815_t:CDS:2, partial [Gigaspora margarita]